MTDSIPDAIRDSSCSPSLDEIEVAIRDCFISADVPDEPVVNLVDVVSGIAPAVARIADAITHNVVGNHDASGGYVTSLTEAVMGATAGLQSIADAIHHLAEAIENRRD